MDPLLREQIGELTGTGVVLVGNQLELSGAGGLRLTAHGRRTAVRELSRGEDLHSALLKALLKSRYDEHSAPLRNLLAGDAPW